MLILQYKKVENLVTGKPYRVALLADVHHHLRKHKEFEANRFELLCTKIAEREYDTVIYLGDLLDKARLTLEEEDSLRVNLGKIKARQIVLDGNHEAKDKDTSTYDYITIPGLEYVTKDILDIHGVKCTFMGWTKLKHYKSVPKGDVLFSHIRSNIGIVKEELDVQYLSKRFKQVVLGDIHSRYQPFDNVMYTSSPYATHFHKNCTRKYGYIEMVITDGEYTLSYKDLDLPTKRAFDCKIQDIDKLVLKYPNDLIKLSVTGTTEQLENLSQHDNVIYSKILQCKTVQHTGDIIEDISVVDKLADIIDKPKDKVINILGAVYKEVT